MNPPALEEIGQIAITVRDVAIAKNFYAETLWLRALFDGGPNLSFLAPGSVRLMLTTP